MFYVYRFLDKNGTIIYVGKSKQDLEQRFRGHIHLPDACYELTYKIEYIECSTEADMSIKEIYYINKFRHNGHFFNVLDMMDTPTSIEFNDEWKQYTGPLNSHFHHSINYLEGYTATQIIRYNKDGSVDRRKSNSQKGVSTYADGLTADEVNLIVDYFIDELNNAENGNQEQIRFRNIMMFVLSINLPLKISEFINLRYQDLFDESDAIKPIKYQLGRFNKDITIAIPIRKSAQEILLAYSKYYGLTYTKNAEDHLFESRNHQVLSSHQCWRIISDAVEAVGIHKNITTESTRKTYGLNIYHRADDKLNAILFLGEIWGNTREANVIKYLNLSDKDVDFDYYLGETFSIGYVDLSKINCLQPCESKYPTNILNEKERNAEKVLLNSQQKKIKNESISSLILKGKKESEKKNISLKAKHEREKSVATPKERKNNHKWTEEELEVIEKHLNQHVPVEILAEEYKVHQNIINCWIYNYKKEMDSQDIIKQTIECRDHGSLVIEEKRKKELVAWFIDTSPYVPRTNKVWTKEIKLEIVKKNLHQYIPQNVLAKEYGAPAGNISRWVSEYKEYGESAFEDKRHKNK